MDRALGSGAAGLCNETRSSGDGTGGSGGKTEGSGGEAGNSGSEIGGIGTAENLGW